MKKINYSWDNLTGGILELSRQINNSNWKPDYIIGITRGGLIPAAMLSHYLNVPMHSLAVKLRDFPDVESNCWMSEDAFARHKKILIVDDMNDSGATFNWIKKDWQSLCLPYDVEWQNVWHNNVRFATLISNTASEFEVDYTAEEINKLDNDAWIDFVWESFWNNNAI